MMYASHKKGGAPLAKGKMTPKAAARIQRLTAKQNGGKVAKGTFAARAQRAASKSAKK